MPACSLTLFLDHADMRFGPAELHCTDDPALDDEVFTDVFGPRYASGDKRIDQWMEDLVR